MPRKPKPLSFYDEIPLSSETLDEVPQILEEVEPIAQHKSAQITFRDAEDLLQLHVGLTPRQIRFAYYYAITKDARNSALEAGYNEASPEKLDKYLSNIIHQLMSHSGVRSLLQALQLRAASTLVIDETYVVHTAAAIAENIEYRASDRIEALKLIAKVRGYFAPIRSEHDIHTRNVDEQKPQEILAALTRVYQDSRGADSLPKIPIDAEYEEK